jgi:thioredoxin-like negative regulator of GroEL
VNSPEVPVDFGVAQIPETFLVSPAGQVVLHVEGEVRAERIIELIEQSN